MFKIYALGFLLLGGIAGAQMLPTGFGSDSIYLVGSNGNSVQLKPGTISTSFSLTLPTDDGTNGDVLQTDGSGILSWTSPTSTSAPAGTIIAFAGSSCPTGYLAADGSLVSRTTYANLWDALEDSGSSPWGNGDGSTTFKVPDLRNRFLRGTGTNGGNGGTDDGSGNAVSLGNYQGDSFQGHRHSVTTNATTRVSGTDTPGGGTWAWGTATLNIGDPTTDGTNGTPRTANETRPKAYGVLFCIKH